MGGRSLGGRMGGRSFCYAILLHHYCLFCEAAAVTDPNEVEALRIIASKIGNTKWNFSVDPCSRDPSWSTNGTIDGNPEEEVGVVCNCPFNKNTICHVLQIKVVYEEMTGIIPPEMANLTYLEHMDLRYNLLHGSIPASLGSLTRMQYLALGANNLSGEIPKEMGKLTNLTSLSFDRNYLSGTIPPELGNLTNLDNFFIFSLTRTIRLSLADHRMYTRIAFKEGSLQVLFLHFIALVLEELAVAH